MDAENFIISHNNDSTKDSFVALIHKIFTAIKPKLIHSYVQSRTYGYLLSTGAWSVESPVTYSGT